MIDVNVNVRKSCVEMVALAFISIRLCSPSRRRFYNNGNRSMYRFRNTLESSFAILWLQLSLTPGRAGQ